jgi:hypothetical protein
MVQDVIVTVVALGALAAIAVPMWRRRARGDAAACPNCAAGESCAPGSTAPRDPTVAQPLNFFSGSSGPLRPAAKSSARK